MRPMPTPAILDSADSLPFELTSDTVLAFDGDGTLWTGDVAQDVWGSLVRERLVKPEALEALQREARAAGIDCPDEAGAVCAAIDAAHDEQRFDEQRMCEVHAWSFAGWQRDELAAFVDRVLFDERKLQQRAIEETQRIVRAAQAVGAGVYVVSASPAHIVERAVRPLGIDAEHVLASRVHWRGDRVLPDIDRPIAYGEGKVLALKRVLGERPLTAAFGDNGFDVPMLKFAAHGFAVRPKLRLLSHPDFTSFQRLTELLPA